MFTFLLPSTRIGSTGHVQQSVVFWYQHGVELLFHFPMPIGIYRCRNIFDCFPILTTRIVLFLHVCVETTPSDHLAGLELAPPFAGPDLPIPHTESPQCWYIVTATSRRPSDDRVGRKIRYQQYCYFERTRCRHDPPRWYDFRHELDRHVVSSRISSRSWRCYRRSKVRHVRDWRYYGSNNHCWCIGVSWPPYGPRRGHGRYKFNQWGREMSPSLTRRHVLITHCW